MSSSNTIDGIALTIAIIGLLHDRYFEPEEFLEAIQSVEPGKWKALVVDEHSKKLLGTVLKNNDILAERVTGSLLVHRYEDGISDGTFV